MMSVRSLVIGVAFLIALSIPITGSIVTNTGDINVTIRPITSLVLFNPIINFGSFYVNSTCGDCITDTNGNYTPCCVGITNVTEGFAIENQGNRNLSVFLNITENATGFIGGSNPSFKYLVKPDSDSVYGGQTDDTIASCSNLLSPQDWTEVNTSINYICGGPGSYPLSMLNSQDAIILHLKIKVPVDALGRKEVGIIFTGTSS